MNQIIETQTKIIELLEGQVIDLTLMSKIELGDDVIAKLSRLKAELKKNLEIHINELSEIASYFQEDGIYALRGLEHRIEDLKSKL